MKHRLVEEPLGPPTEERKNCVGNSFGEEMFAEMKLGTKLACAFGLLVVLAALTGGVAIERLSAVNHAADTLAKTWLPSIKLLGDIRNTANAFRRLENRHLVAGSSKEMDELEAMMADSRKYMAELQKKYEAFVDDNVEKAAYNEMQQRLDAYWATSVNFVALSRRNSEDSAGEAKAYMRGASNAAFQALLDTQAKLVAINEKGADEAHDSAEATYNSARLMLLALIAGAFLVSVVCAVLIIRTVSRQLGGEPAYAAGVAKRIADGDLSVNVNIKPNDKSSMLAAMRDMEQQLTSIVRGIKGSSDTIASAAQQIAAGNADLSQRTEQQASSLEETASSMEELTGTVKQNAENARQANQLAAGASNVAVKGGEVVDQVVATMSSINESSKKIADIIGVIDGIAFQTNILALNAAVEAARAGEQGRGFAVVASEVRNARAEKRRGGEGDQGAHHRLREQGRPRHQARRRGRQDDGRDRRLGETGDRHHGRDRGGIRGADLGHRAGEPGHHADGPGDTAERGVGRRSRGGSGIDAAAVTTSDQGRFDLQAQSGGDRRFPCPHAAPG